MLRLHWHGMDSANLYTLLFRFITSSGAFSLVVLLYSAHHEVPNYSRQSSYTLKGI